MGIKIDLINMLQELLYFDIFEAFFIVSFVLISNKLRVGKLQFAFHVFMIGVLDLLIPRLIPIPILQQIIGILSYSLYFMFVFRLKFINSLLLNIKIFFIFFILEMTLSLCYQYIFNISIVSMINNFNKFIYMLPFRGIEIFFIIYLYKYERR